MPEPRRIAALALAIVLVVAFTLLIARLRQPHCAREPAGSLIRFLHCKGGTRHG